MPVQTVVGDIQFCVGKPSDVKIIGRRPVIEIRHLVPFFEPCHLFFRDLPPEAVRVVERFLPQLLILVVTTDVGFFSKIFGYRIHLFELYICHENLHLLG